MTRRAAALSFHNAEVSGHAQGSRWRRPVGKDPDDVGASAVARPNHIGCSWSGVVMTMGTRGTEATATETQSFPAVPQFSCSPVSANGVPALWIEVAIATVGQPTVVYLRRRRPGTTPGAVHSDATRIALRTGARIFEIECSTVSEAVTAYTWLLGEGLDLETTTLISCPSDDHFPAAIRRALQRLGLPLPNGLSPGRAVLARERRGPPTGGKAPGS